MKKAVAILFTCWFTFSSAKVSLKEKEKINWISIEELHLKSASESKPVLIDLYTSWCYWCKVMDKKTYNNDKVVAYINDHFYAVKLNAETKSTVIWNKKYYNYSESNNLNEFTLYVTQGQPGFPTTTIFPDIKGNPSSIPGFMEPKEIEPVLKYFGEGNYKTQTFNEFLANFKKTW